MLASKQNYPTKCLIVSNHQLKKCHEMNINSQITSSVMSRFKTPQSKAAARALRKYWRCQNRLSRDDRRWKHENANRWFTIERKQNCSVLQSAWRIDFSSSPFRIITARKFETTPRQSIAIICKLLSEVVKNAFLSKARVFTWRWRKWASFQGADRQQWSGFQRTRCCSSSNRDKSCQHFLHLFSALDLERDSY